MEQARGTDPESSRLMTQAPAQGQRQAVPDFLHGLAVALHILQAERQGRLDDITEHLAKERLMLLLADAQAGLGHVVAIRHRSRQRRVEAQQARLHLLTHGLQGRMVEHDMVEQQERDDTGMLRIRGMHQPYQRRLADVHAVVAGVETRLQLREDIALGGVQRHLLHHQRGLAQDHLHRPVQAFPDQSGAQDIVAVDHPLQGTGKGLQALDTGKDHL